MSIWSYCLLPNHVHIIADPGDEDGLRRTFRHVRRHYTGYINARMRVTGNYGGNYGDSYRDYGDRDYGYSYRIKALPAHPTKGFQCRNSLALLRQQFAPASPEYQAHAATNFVNWRLVVFVWLLKNVDHLTFRAARAPLSATEIHEVHSPQSGPCVLVPVPTTFATFMAVAT